MVKLVESPAESLSANDSCQLNEVAVKTLRETLCAEIDIDYQELKPTTLSVELEPYQGQTDNERGLLCRPGEYFAEIQTTRPLWDTFKGMVNFPPERACSQQTMDTRTLVPAKCRSKTKHAFSLEVRCHSFSAGKATAG